MNLYIPVKKIIWLNTKHADFNNTNLSLFNLSCWLWGGGAYNTKALGIFGSYKARFG